jgi:two-component system, cell cycle response regulator
VNWDEITQVKGPPSDIAKPAPRRDQAYLIVLAGSASGETFKLGRERTVIGRGPKADIRMLDEGISREHFEVLVEGDKVLLRDLGSTNGTYCRGTRVDFHQLADGDKILIGTNTVLKFSYHDRIDQVLETQAYESAIRDSLTKAFSRNYFLDRVDSEYAYSSRHSTPLALVSFDIDHFKAVNDTYGQHAGDFVLSELARTTHAQVRVEDVFARVGGEEFSVVCRGADLIQGKIVGERLRRAVERRQFVHEGQVITVTISVGVAAVPNPSIREAKEFIAAANQVLSEAKRGGRNRVCI